MLVIGLTGGIGSGKSTVAKLFAQHGTPIIDADLIARELTAIETPAWKKIREQFGPSILKPDQALDRQKLRQQVFNDPQQRKWLENLLHPLINQEIQRQLQSLNASYCIVVIPLLVETGPFPFLNRILVVDAPEEMQVDRLKVRDQAIADDLHKIIASQVKREQRVAAAQDVIVNVGAEAELIPQVDKLHHLYIALAASK